MKTTSRFALAAVAGLFVGGLALTAAKAADLGGDCCADLEERIAELEATTARKGNRKVSLTISGQVNRALLIWDDGVDSDAYVVDNSNSSTRFRFTGSATMKPGWKTGFLVEIELRDAASSLVDQSNDDIRTVDERNLRTRHANWYIESEQLGRVTVGQGSAATKDIVLINLGGSLSDADLYYNNSFGLRTVTGGFQTVRNTNALGVLQDTRLTWSALAGAMDGQRIDGIRYDTPSIYGFILSAAWGENDYFDIALRFKKEWNSIRIAAGIGYSWDGDLQTFNLSNLVGRVRGSGEIEEVKGSLSVMHVPTGLYASFAAGARDASDFVRTSGTVADRDGYDADFWYLQLGITQKWLSYGPTTIYGEYGKYNDFAVGLDTTGNIGGVGLITSSEATRWGFGITQAFDSAALELYGQFHYYEADVTALDANSRPEKLNLEDWYGVVMGARIRF
jgi:hypothetical protein